MPVKRISSMISSAVDWIELVQNRDGGLPSDKEGAPSCTWTTSGLLWASWTAGVSFREFYARRALMWVLGEHNTDSGIPVVVRGDPSITDATAQTALACSLALREQSEEAFRVGLVKCVQWLLYARLGKGGWNWRQSKESEWIASSAYGILALHYSQGLKDLGSDVENGLRQGVRWLKNSRNRDGGWGSYKGDRSRAAITGLVAATLCEIGADFDRAKAVSFILSQQGKDGSWPDAIDRPTGHTVTRIGTANCVRALGLCEFPLDAREFDGALGALNAAFHRTRFRYRDADIFSWPTRDYLLALTVLGKRLGIPGCRTLSVLASAPLSVAATAVSAVTTVDPPTMKASSKDLVTILHVSDIHRSPDAPTSNVSLIGKLVDDITDTYNEDNSRLEATEPTLARPDIIVVSGDLTQRATPPDYDTALRFLEELVALVGGDRRRVVLIPGNHDIHWPLSAACYTRSSKAAFRRERPRHEPYRQRIKKAADGTYWERDETRYTDRFRYFKEMFDQFYKGAYTYSLARDRMYSVYDFSVTDGLIIAGFNSCDEIDAYQAKDGSLRSLDRRAFIDTDAIYNAKQDVDVKASDPTVVRLAVFHHNIRSVDHGEDFLDPKYLQILKRHGFALGLHGHVHTASWDIFDPTQDRTLPVIGAGSLAAPYGDRPPAAPMGYNVVVVDRSRREAWVHTRRHDENSLVWAADYRWNGRPCFKAAVLD